MATPVEAPKLGNSVEECVVTRWIKKKGDKVVAGDVVLDIETDKATFEVSTPAAGLILETFFSEGDLVPVFTTLFVVGETGEDVERFRPDSPRRAASEAAATAPVVVDEPAVKVVIATGGNLSPRAKRYAEEHDFDVTGVPGSGPGGRVLEQDVRDAYLSSPRVSGAARRQIATGLHAPDMGSGAGGMILSSDLSQAAPPPPKMAPMRDKIARRMRESLASTAQYTLHAYANAGGLLLLRARVKASKSVADININDMVTFCTVKALQDVPALNALFVDGRIDSRTEVNIGFATDTQRGLLVPVVHDAHKLTIAELATKMKELAAKAVSGTITPDEMSGATFTVSNLGGLGIEYFTPLLNPPQVGILGVGAISIKPVRASGRLEFIDAISLSLTCDHQVIDGAPGARFLQVLKEKIENVESMCTI